MARTDTLGNFLTDVADAIRTKKGSSDTIQASNFDTEIENLPSGGDISDYYKDTITNGTTSMAGYIKAINKLPALTPSSSITDCNYMFYYFQGVEIDLKNFNIPNVINTQAMFRGCTNLTTLKNSNFMYISNLRNAKEMFRGCEQLQELDLSNCNGANIGSLDSMFLYCSSLSKLDIRNFEFGSVTSSSNTFGGVPSNCLIIVKDNTAKTWVLSQRSDFTNVKTVAEYEAEQSE